MKYYHSRDSKHIHYLQNFPCAPYNVQVCLLAIPPDKYLLACCHSELVWIFLGFIHHTFLFACLLLVQLVLFSITILRFIHVDFFNGLSFLLLSSILLYGYAKICLAINLQMGTCSQYLPVKNKAALNILIQCFVQMYAFLLLGKYQQEKGWIIFLRSY